MALVTSTLKKKADRVFYNLDEFDADRFCREINNMVDLGLESKMGSETLRAIGFLSDLKIRIEETREFLRELDEHFDDLKHAESSC